MSGRNETARGRRRNKFKDEESMLSVPISAIASQSDEGINYTRLNLGNHFAWRMIGMTRVGDGEFPYLAQFLEKPDIDGDFKKETYVLYLEKGAAIDRESSIKQTQTGDSVVHVPVKPSKPRVTLPPEKEEEPVIEEELLVDEPEEEAKEEVAEDKEKRRPKRKKKLISEFYYIPKERSRSRKRSLSKESNEGGDHVIIKLTPDPSKSSSIEKEHVEEKVKEEVITKEEETKSKTRKGRGRGPDRWQLRAGAEHVSETTLSDKTESKSIKLNDRSSEYLLESPSGTNKYLYLSKERLNSRNTSGSK